MYRFMLIGPSFEREKFLKKLEYNQRKGVYIYKSNAKENHPENEIFIQVPVLYDLKFLCNSKNLFKEATGIIFLHAETPSKDKVSLSNLASQIPKDKLIYTFMQGENRQEFLEDIINDIQQFKTENPIIKSRQIKIR